MAESQSLTLDDLDLHSIRTGYYEVQFNKHVCFKRSEITEINFTDGAHKSNEKGNVKYGKQVYMLKHMNFMGLPWYTEKMKARFNRTHYNRSKFRCSGHYTNDPTIIEKRWENTLKLAKPLPF